MRLDDLLRVMRDEFAQAADLIDEQVLAWLGGAAAAEAAVTRLVTELDRLAATSRVISLEGLALALEQMRDGATALALIDDEATLGEGLTWLAGWRPAFEQAFGEPGAAEPADALLGWLAGSPLAPDAELLAALREALVVAPALPGPDGEADDALLPAATDDDVSLVVPEDVDRDLYETFLADAPGQLARLADVLAALVAGAVPVPRLQEAQRVAHTFKGSGNIVGVRGIGRVAHRIEDLIEHAIEQGGTLPPAMAHDLEQAGATLGQMIGALRGEEPPPGDARERLQSLLDWIGAIREGTVDEFAAGRGAVPVAPRAAAPAAAAMAASEPEPASAAAAPEAEAQLRIGVSRLERVLRRAGMGVVQGARLAERVGQLETRLAAFETSQRDLRQRLSELLTAIDRQGVTLREQAEAAGADFDPLEMDRYDQLHTLARFVAELVDDGGEHLRGARDEAAGTGGTLREHAQALADQYHELLEARLLPFGHVVPRLKRTVVQTAATLGRRALLVVEGDSAPLDAEVLERLTEPLLHLLRNAVDHGIEPPDERLLLGKPEQGTIRLVVRRDGHTVRLACSDDGRGIDAAAVQQRALALGLIGADETPTPEAVARLLLLPGFSTRDTVTEVSGRGVGLDVVAERVRSMKGRVEIASVPHQGTTITLEVPATIGAMHVLVVECGGEPFALPTAAVVRALAAGQGTHAGGRLTEGDASWPLIEAAERCALPAPARPPHERPAVLLRTGAGVVALAVERVLDARELVLQDVGALLRRLRGASAGAFRPDGRPLFVLDPDLFAPEAGARAIGRAAAAELRRRATAARRRVLVVDDAISVRKALMQLLSDAGFETHGARDGFDALQRLGEQPVDLVLTDLEMPNLNGLDLVRHLRREPATARLPVAMITSRASDKHRRAALDAGVDRYLTKPYTDADLLAQVRELLLEAQRA